MVKGRHGFSRYAIFENLKKCGIESPRTFGGVDNVGCTFAAFSVQAMAAGTIAVNACGLLRYLASTQLG